MISARWCAGMPMLMNSVIRLTGQAWKLYLALVALMAGSVVPAFPAAGLSWTAGTVLALLGYAFAVTAIACPRCRKRWFWVAATRAERYKPLLTAPSCPECGAGFGEPESSS